MIVIDASAFLEVLMRSTSGLAVEALLEDTMAPDLLDAEVFHRLVRAGQGGALQPAQLDERLALLYDAPIERIPCRELLTGPPVRHCDVRIRRALCRPRWKPAMPAGHYGRTPGAYRNNTVRSHRHPRSNEWPVIFGESGCDDTPQDPAALTETSRGSPMADHDAYPMASTATPRTARGVSFASTRSRSGSLPNPGRNMTRCWG